MNRRSYDIPPVPGVSKKRVAELLDALYHRPHRIVREVELIASGLQVVGMLAERFANNHPYGCTCDDNEFCREVRRDMEAIRYTLPLFAETALASGGIFMTPTESYGDDFRKLGEIADRLDAVSEEEPEKAVARKRRRN